MSWRRESATWQGAGITHKERYSALKHQNIPPTLSRSTSKVNLEMARTIVLFPGSLGDFLCFLPALQAIGEHQHKLVVVGREATRALLEALVCFPQSVSVQTVSLDDARFARLFASCSSAKDADLDRFFLHATSVLSWFGASLPQMKKNLEKYAPGRVSVFPFFSGQVESHAGVYYLSCLREQGKKRLYRPLSVQLKEPGLQWGVEYWRQRGWESKQVLVVHPGSGGQRKRWRAEGFRHVAERWRGSGDREVLILLGPAEAEEGEYWRRYGHVETSLELAQVASVLTRATCYIGNDSGVSHLAGAVGTQGVVIFGPTRPEQWCPLGRGIQIIKNTSYRKKWPAREGISLEEVAPEQVLERLSV